MVDQTPTLDELRQRITEIRALLARMATLETNLQAAARQAGEQADNAGSAAEMDRYETLYLETQLRLRELRDQQRELSTLLEQLEAALAALDGHEP